LGYKAFDVRLVQVHVGSNDAMTEPQLDNT
jgi:hypothetical protein